MIGIDEKFELVEKLLDYMTAEEVLEAFILAMSTDDVRDVVAYIARMHEIDIQRWNCHRWIFFACITLDNMDYIKYN